ncbi:GntR family transcriptional regulator [Sporolactobacillus shoreae]|uniref:GntR family transcriptional regulator n=1 Tax=Sporolactobacillus shoreae TaxID=1465501 RepID=A0A4Z0GPL5_9BACL|nr:GntR family transcriptional regulator [Sporolactobacillus shoreae]TGA97976.1 GntR family transcriptional regulator [Sporolactobacillus shoreae]
MDERQVGSLSFSIDFSQPLYEQILTQMRSLIARGTIGLGEKIPSVREMAHELKINPNTVMHAYQELERDGLTEKRRGQGTFATTSMMKIKQFKERFALEYAQDFLENMHSLGFNLNEIHTYLTRLSQEKGHRKND